MPINSYTVGPGVFTLGVGPTAFEAQVRSCVVKVSENVKTVEAVPMLSGDELAEEETASYKYTVNVSFQQDLGTAGIVDYTWDNEGDTVPFTYEPNTTDGATIVGTCRIVPLDIGGDPKTRPSSDVVFSCPAKPTFTPS